MIIVKLMGGLGNQMFQYATARRLALRLGADVAFDVSYYQQSPDEDTPRQYELSPFNLSERFSTPLENAEMSGIYLNIWQEALVRMRRITGLSRYAKSLFRERPGHFCPEVLQLPDNVYLMGYWQSDRYFMDVAEIIREDLTVRMEPAGKNRELAEKITGSESVAVHFRRGDYVNSAKTAAYHGVLPLAYYHQALGLLRERVEKPLLFVFSDDPEWVRHNVTFPVPVEIVDHNPPEKGYEDLRLMSLCKHAIIANSSFSWWGAWLNRNPGKIVIAPHRWFTDESINTSHLIPADWVRVAAK